MNNATPQVSDTEKRRIEEFLHALRTPCTVTRNETSFFNVASFEEEFRSKLLTHHCFMGSPLFQESFDSAFIAACRYAGLQIRLAPEGQRFWDVAVAGRNISLKSSKAKSLRDKTLHISKLTEAAWIQDCRSAKTRRDRTIELFDQYASIVHSIIQLRYFESRSFHELVEIPVSLFSQIASVELVHFNADGPTINIPVGQVPPDFTLKLDRSDAKITIANVNKMLCTVHGTWQL
jgi:hypothetical protein